MLHQRPGVIVPSAARGIRRVRGGLRHHPWNLNRFTPAEGARRRGSRPARRLPADRSEPCPRPRSPRPFRPCPTPRPATTATPSRARPRSTSTAPTASACRCANRALGRRAAARRLRHERPAGRRRPRRAAGAAARVDPRPRGRRGRAAPPAGRRAADMREALQGAHAPGAARHRAGDAAALRAPGEITPEMEFIAMREGLAGRVRPRRGRARPRHHPGQHQPPRARADDHRPQLPGEDQRQHRQLRRVARRSRRRSRSCAGRRSGAPTR